MHHDGIGITRQWPRHCTCTAMMQPALQQHLFLPTDFDDLCALLMPA